MEQNNKRKIDVEIAGISMTLVTDEADAFVNSVVRRLDESMSALLSHNIKRSRLDAAMLCAIDFCSDKLVAEKRVRNLEAQISLYDVNLKRLREEVATLKKQLETPDTSKTVHGEQISIPIGSQNATDNKGDTSVLSSNSSASENELSDKKTVEEPSDKPAENSISEKKNSSSPSGIADKLKMIESLLKGDGGNN